MVRYFLVLLVGVCAAGVAPAASWADAMFGELSRDFGSVPRGPTLGHAFRLANRTTDTVHISGIRTSCGCVTATAGKSDLAPGQETTIVAQMDTRRFSGPKTVTIYVQFDQPAWEEVRLWVQANSRDDVSVNPESLAFGLSRRGTTPAVSVTITLLGSSDWQVLGAKCESNYVQVKLSELRRDAAEVSYQVAAELRPDAPVGQWFTDVWVATNNPYTPRLRIPLTVEIQSSLSVSPSVAIIGQVKTGTEVERRVIVRGVKPFRITAIHGTDDLLTVRDSAPASKLVHVLTIKLKAASLGDFDRALRVLTDLKDEGEIDFRATAQIVP
jgi:hypothetical protein